MLKNKDKIVDDHLKLYFYSINKDQKLAVMYLELIFTGIKTERCRGTEVPKIAYLEIAVGRKDFLCMDQDE